MEVHGKFWKTLEHSKRFSATTFEYVRIFLVEYSGLRLAATTIYGSLTSMTFDKSIIPRIENLNTNCSRC